MKKAGICLFVSFGSVIAGCHTVRKSSSSPAKSVDQPSVSDPAPSPLILLKPETGVNMPGDAELKAIQLAYADITMEKLKEGYFIYNKGACINCHGAANIYQYGESAWKNIIDDMAEKAAISALQKDAVYKYVLSIKATQPK